MKRSMVVFGAVIAVLIVLRVATDPADVLVGFLAVTISAVVVLTVMIALRIMTDGLWLVRLTEFREPVRRVIKSRVVRGEVESDTLDDIQPVTEDIPVIHALTSGDVELTTSDTDD